MSKDNIQELRQSSLPNILSGVIPIGKRFPCCSICNIFLNNWPSIECILPAAMDALVKPLSLGVKKCV